MISFPFHLIPFQHFNFINKKKIIITGVEGMDGSNLAEYILNTYNDVLIFGTMRNFGKITHVNLKNIIFNNNFFPVYMDLTNYNYTKLLFQVINPSLFFNCGAQTIVDYKARKNNPNFFNTLQINTLTPLMHLDFIKTNKLNCRYLSCGSSEEFGYTQYTPQNLSHPKHPINLYGISKNTTHQIIKFYRKYYDIYCCHVILFNHEDVKRPQHFLSKKIAINVAQIKYNIINNIPIKPLTVGNIFSYRDWSYSNDIVIGLWKILNHIGKPDDYILSSNKKYSIKDFIDIAFSCINVHLNWIIDDNPLNHKAYYKNILLVKINPQFYRDVDKNRSFQGCNQKACSLLKWKPTENLKILLNNMINYEFDIIKNTI